MVQFIKAPYSGYLPYTHPAFTPYGVFTLFYLLSEQPNRKGNANAWTNPVHTVVMVVIVQPRLMTYILNAVPGIY